MPAPLYRPKVEALRRRRWASSLARSTGGGLAPPVVEIPFSWIAPPLTRKPTNAITVAAVTQAGASTAYSAAADALVRRFGAVATTVTLDTAVDADAQNLAHFLVTYQATPRPRQPTLTLNLYNRTDAECLLILGVDLAQRVRVIGAPVGTPPGALNFTVEGIRHTAAVDRRTVTWSTAAIIGTGTTTPGPWFRTGSSAYGGTDIVPF
jgi:hypothetical protein